MMKGIADEVGSSMLSAANATANASFEGALGAQTTALSLLNQLYMIAAPYENVLQRSVQLQTSLAPQESAAEPGDQPDSDNEDGEQSKPTSAVALTVGEDDAENQNRISDWARLIPLKADAVGKPV